MERGSIDSNASTDSASTLASFSSSVRNSLTAGSSCSDSIFTDGDSGSGSGCGGGGFLSDVSGNVSSSSCETLYERRRRTRLARVQTQCHLPPSSPSPSDHPGGQADPPPSPPSEHQRHVYDNRNCVGQHHPTVVTDYSLLVNRTPTSCEKRKFPSTTYCCSGNRKPVGQNSVVIADLSANESGSSRHTVVLAPQQSARSHIVVLQPQRDSALTSPSVKERYSNVLNHNPAHIEPEDSVFNNNHHWQVNYQHYHPLLNQPQQHCPQQQQQQQQQYQGQQHQSQERLKPSSNSPKSPISPKSPKPPKSPKSPKADDPSSLKSQYIAQHLQREQEQQQLRQLLERKHSAPHNQKHSQRLERKLSFCRLYHLQKQLEHHHQQQQQHQPLRQHIERGSFLPRHQQHSLRPDSCSSDQAKSPQSRSSKRTSKMNRSATDLHQQDEWVDLPPRARLHTVSGSGSYVTGYYSTGNYVTSTHVTSPSAAASSPCCQATASSSVSPKPHQRTTSLKKPRKKAFDMSDFDEMRPRTSSLPTRNNVRRPNLQYLSPPPFSPSSCRSEQDDVYPLRSFVTTPKGQLVNRGDSWRSRSASSVMSSGSGSQTELTHLSEFSSQCSLAHSQGSVDNCCGPESPAASVPYRVLMLGGPGVGKSSLTEQFATSEYLGTFGPSIDTYREKSVSLLIDGEESTVDFIDPVVEVDSVTDESIDGFVVVFRIDDRSTFSHATDLLYDLRKVKAVNSAVILVANKCDLVRSREVSTEEAKSVAATYDCKYVETSVVLNHNVDELLVGIVTQMRLLSEGRKGRKKSRHGATDESGCYARSKHLLSKIFRKYPISKSCENLYVL